MSGDTKCAGQILRKNRNKKQNTKQKQTNKQKKHKTKQKQNKKLHGLAVEINAFYVDFDNGIYINQILKFKVFPLRHPSNGQE